MPVCMLDVEHRATILAAGGWDEYGDPSVGEWSWIDDWVRSIGLDPGPPYLAQTYGGGHSSTSWHYTGRGATARDYGASGVDHVAIARAAEPLALYSSANVDRYGHPFPIQELFCEDVGIRYSGGARSSFRDNPGHTHIAKVLEIRLVQPTEPKPVPLPKETDMAFRYQTTKGVTYISDGLFRRKVQSGGIDNALGRYKLRASAGDENTAFDLSPPVWADKPKEQILQDDVHNQFVDLDELLDLLRKK